LTLKVEEVILRERSDRRIYIVWQILRCAQDDRLKKIDVCGREFRKPVQSRRGPATVTGATRVLTSH
jgi:hypothetical protein